MKLPKVLSAFHINVNRLPQMKVALNIYIILARTPEIGQGLGRILSCGARKQEQT